MNINFIVAKLEALSGLPLNQKQLQEIPILLKNHENNVYNLHNRFKLLSEQIQLGICDLNDRLIKLNERKRDSSSLTSFIIKYGEEEGTKRFNLKISKTKQTLEGFILKFGEIDGPIKYKEYCVNKGASLDGFISRHGKEEGEAKWREYWNTTGFGTSERAFIKRFGDELYKEKFEEFKSKIGYMNTLEYHIEEYGEEIGTEKYNKTNLKRNESLSKENFIIQLQSEGYSVEEILDKIDFRWNQTSLKSFVRKYGELEGKLKFEEYSNKLKKSSVLCKEYYFDKPEFNAFDEISKIQIQRNSNVTRYSKESLYYLTPLFEYYDSSGIESLYKEKEYCIKLTETEYNVSGQRFMYYDFTLPSKNVIIEYHGEYYHDDVDYDKTIHMKFEDFVINYNRDLFKKWLAESKGFTVYVLRSWEIKSDLLNLYNNLKFTEDLLWKLI